MSPLSMVPQVHLSLIELNCEAPRWVCTINFPVPSDERFKFLEVYLHVRIPAILDSAFTDCPPSSEDPSQSLSLSLAPGAHKLPLWLPGTHGTVYFPRPGTTPVHRQALLPLTSNICFLGSFHSTTCLWLFFQQGWSPNLVPSNDHLSFFEFLGFCYSLDLE